MRTHLLARACASALLLGVVACGGQDASAARAPDPSTEGVFTPFGLDLFRSLAAATGDNVVVSPPAVGIVLAMVLEGAAGGTRDSLAAALHLPPEGSAASARIAGLLASLRDQRAVTMSVAQSAWVDDEVALSPAFAERIGRSYDAQITSVDLQSSATADRVNSWVSDATHGRIPKAIDGPLDEQAKLLLASAVYFKGKWATEFDPAATTPRPFRFPDGRRPHATMSQIGDFAYADGDGFRSARLPYRGGRFALYVLLPDDSLGAAALVSRLDAKLLRTTFADMRPAKLDVELPRFVVRTKNELEPALSALGMGRAFDEAVAEFPLVLRDATRRRLWLSRVTQSTFVRIDEEGTEAAAAAVVEMVDDTTAVTAPIPFVVDRPFLFLLRDDRTGEILFLGRISNPEEAP